MNKLKTIYNKKITFHIYLVIKINFKRLLAIKIDNYKSSKVAI